MGKYSGGSHNVGSAEALVVNAKQVQAQRRFYDQCRYCDERHWSGECYHFKTMEERCMKVRHLAKDCVINKTCAYCGEANAHHRSLCSKKYKSNVTSTYLSGETNFMSRTDTKIEENVLISSEEIVLMQTATTEIRNSNHSCSARTQFLLD